MKEGLIKDAYELVIKEIQTLITILYLLMVGIGMLFNYKKYSAFGINIFEYADVFDFLIAPFQDTNIIVASVIAAILPLMILWVDGYIKKRFPKTYSKGNFGWDKKNWYNKLRLLSFGVLLLYFISEASTGYGNFMKKHIPKQDPIAIKFTDDEIINGQLIGKTKEVIFVLLDQKVKVIPLTSSVKEIEFDLVD